MPDDAGNINGRKQRDVSDQAISLRIIPLHNFPSPRRRRSWAYSVLPNLQMRSVYIAVSIEPCS